MDLIRNVLAPAGQCIPAWNHPQNFIIFAGPDTGVGVVMCFDCC